MANEHTLYVQTSLPLPMTVADGTGIEKGALLKLADPLTVSTSDGKDDVAGGIAFGEKIASNGVTTLAVFRSGIFRAIASGSVTVGDQLGSTADFPNYLYSQSESSGLSGSRTFGTALQTATVGQTFLYELNPQATASTPV